jgi:xylan 1,4-beta-xylosidase
VRGQIKASGRPNLPLFWTEWNVPGRYELRDTTYVAPAVAYDILQCDGLVDMLSFWTFDDVFEETGPPPDSFHGGFGLIAVGGIRKPSYFGFSLLHKLGDERLANPAQNALVTRRADGTIVVALWSLGPADPTASGPPIRTRVEFRNVAPSATVLISRADETHGNTLAIQKRLGSPRYPTQAQIEQINREGQLGPPETATLNNGGIEMTIPGNGLVVLQVLP